VALQLGPQCSQPPYQGDGMMRGTIWTWNPYAGQRHDPRCCVYRIYDPQSHELLYVGQTCVSLKSRIKSHWKAKAWFQWDWSKALVTYVECSSYMESLFVEAAAIRDEHPRHNMERPNPEAFDPEQVARFSAWLAKADA
jgi:hypothetical protein